MLHDICVCFCNDIPFGISRKKLSQKAKCVSDTITALTADGNKFAHPLHHLGKSTADLPLIAIDSFKHMYLFKHDVKSKLG